MVRPFLASALDGGEWSASRPGRFTPGERASSTHWIKGWVGPRAGLDAVEKRTISFPCQKSNPGRPAAAHRNTEIWGVYLLLVGIKANEACRIADIAFENKIHIFTHLYVYIYIYNFGDV
jgi:hypothetical protein